MIFVAMIFVAMIFVAMIFAVKIFVAVMIAVVEKIAGDMGEKAKIGKLNIDENPNIAAEYNVMSIPTLIIYKDGEVINQFVGVQGEDVLVDAINSAI